MTKIIENAKCRGQKWVTHWVKHDLVCLEQNCLKSPALLVSPSGGVWGVSVGSADAGVLEGAGGGWPSLPSLPGAAVGVGRGLSVQPAGLTEGQGRARAQPADPQQCLLACVGQICG